VELLPSPWHSALDVLVRSVRAELTIVSPFITRSATARVLDILRKEHSRSLRVHIVTDLSVTHLIDGALDPAAIVDVLDLFPSTVVSIAPRLHAKAYLADRSVAIVTSANLTDGGLYFNKEYGVLLRDPMHVSQLKQDIEAYASLGSRTSRTRLEALVAATDSVRKSRDRLMRSARRALREEFQTQVEETATQILRARAEGKTTHSLFSDAVLYLLQHRGPLTTRQLHPLLKAIHPDLCDDSLDRVIDGVHFGKRWKHYVRNAQQYLKRKGLAAFDGRVWRAA
jgi:phosphatidylserine/phosphatidylglycerophosphate/cardiolipin synthase-like enzyme